ncbi:MAG: GntR family transcriptional regulator [Bacilli bacterium]
MHTPLYEEIYVFFRSEIVSGRLAPGSAFPTEKDLGQQFGVSRITTGRALKRLVLEGLIVRRPGKGSFVIDAPASAPPMSNETTGYAEHTEQAAYSGPAGQVGYADYTEQATHVGRAGHAGYTEQATHSGRAEHAGYTETALTTAPDIQTATSIPNGPADAAEQSCLSIGFVIPDWNDSYGIHILDGIERAANANRVCLSINRSYGVQATEEDVLTRMIQSGVQGLIVYPVNGEFYNTKILRLHLDDFPIVFIDRYLPKISIPYIATENEAAARELTRYLIDLGHRNIALFSPPKEDTTPLVDRFRGYMSSLREAQCAVDPALALFDFPTSIFVDRKHRYDPSHSAAIHRFFHDHPEVTAVIAMEYELAALTLRVCQSMGKRVPQDMSIACFDGPENNNSWLMITHMRQQEQVMGQRAVDMLIEHIAHPDHPLTPSVLLSAELIVGDTTCPPENAG